MGKNVRNVKTGELVKKPWGREEIEYSRDGLMVKKLTMLAGAMCSVQLHELKREVATVLSGKLEYVTLKPGVLKIPETRRTMATIKKFIKSRLVLKTGQIAVVEPGTIHYMAGLKADAVYREVSIGPNETVRIFDPNKHLREAKDLAEI